MHWVTMNAHESDVKQWSLLCILMYPIDVCGSIASSQTTVHWVRYLQV